MARNLRIEDPVYVPCSRVNLQDQPFALYSTRVLEVAGRSVRVALPNGRQSDLIGESLVHRNVGVALIRIGDFATETTLLDPLAKSMVQYGRLLFEDSMLVRQEFRSLAELGTWWGANHAAYSHIVLIGHGCRNGIGFAVDGLVSPRQLADVMPSDAQTRKVIISLCCNTGYAAFAQELSRHETCSAVIAPFNAVHGAVASQFCQSFLAFHFLQGETTAVAFRHARMGVPGSTSFRLWQGGVMSIASGRSR